MHPKADEFILDIRRAVRLETKATLTTDSALIDPTAMANVIERATLWLTQRIVKNYELVAFSTSSPALQEKLGQAVDRFRAEAEEFASQKPVTHSQAEMAVQAFSRLKEVVRKVTLEEWTTAASKLVDVVERWAKSFGWVTRRVKKTLNELLLGEYELEQLYMHAEGNHYILDPVTRFNPGGSGLFDLCPSSRRFTARPFTETQPATGMTTGMLARV